MGSVMEQTLTAETIGFDYGKRPVLRNLFLEVPQGTLAVLLGANGSGKSTLLRILAGLKTPSTGHVRLNGQDLHRMKPANRARLIGFLPQQHRPVFPFAVEEVVLTGRAARVRLMPGPEDREQTRLALEQVGISHLRQRLFTELSGGEQQLVMIARVLAQQPKIIMLDEPTAHLDLHFQARLMQLLRMLVREGLTVIAVLHDPNQAISLADRFYFLKDGTCLAPPEHLSPWDVSFLSQVYSTPLQEVAFGSRPLVFPLFSNGFTD
jgi:iron complex transport system ATP-binding protein